ncbi:MAG: VOC family protein [Spirochaetae bacterium HGW-Spirochaetae-3]|jgi:glyoxylase I family protein|nr:MAG: VOC family protein [Spirochaetae bacterium HGW-Spirochaetae-3]
MSEPAGPVGLLAVHHVAAICSDYERSKRFYVEALGFGVVAEAWRPASNSWKLDLALGGRFVLELFWFQNPPPRPDAPEAAGLRHLAFAVADIEASRAALESRGVTVEPVRVDPATGKRYTFFKDPDGLPLELYEA